MADSILEFAPFRVNVLNWLKIPPFKNLSGLEQTRSERKTGLVLFSCGLPLAKINLAPFARPIR